jgi:3-dehydroquinate dehydratase type I
MRNKYCLPIIQPSKANVLATIGQHRRYYAFFEVWLDYIADLDEAFVRGLVADLQEKLVVVFRRQQLEPITMPLAQRVKLLGLFDRSPAYVDLDVSSQQDELEHIARNSLAVNTVVSHHDYRQTPALGELHDLAGQIAKHSPTILKIATMCNSPADAVNLLQLQQTLLARKQRHIILGMGEHGAVTRIFGTLWGNELIFVPPARNLASAPGQLTRDQLDTITTILKG